MALSLWQTEAFDLVIADCNMPVMSGYELVRAIRDEEQRLQRAPTVILGFTANAQPEEIARCKEAGMDDCLFKPLTLTALSHWIENLNPEAQSPAFNLEGLQQLTGGNPALDLRLLNELLKSNRLDRQELLAVPSTAEPQAFLDIAHKIKGAARIIQASCLIDSCESLEAACQGPLDAEAVSDCTQAMARDMVQLELALLQQISEHERSTKGEP